MSGSVIQVEQERFQPFWKGYFFLTLYLNAFWLAGTLAASLSAQFAYVFIFDRRRYLQSGTEEIKRSGTL